jgi:hypothetical protein
VSRSKGHALPAYRGSTKATTVVLSIQVRAGFFHLFGAGNPSLRNLHQYSSIRFRNSARHTPAFGGVFTKFFGVITPNISICCHVEFRMKSILETQIGNG